MTTTTTLENELRTMGHRVLAEAKREIEKTGRLTPVFLVQENNGEFRRFDLRGEMGELMNRPDAKDALFGFVREYIRQHQATGAIFVTEAWLTRTTPAGQKFGTDEFLRLFREIGPERLVARGLAERLEAIIVTVHSAEQVATLTQPFERHEKLKLVSFGLLETQEMPQANFAGRQKMFGDLRPENLR